MLNVFRRLVEMSYLYAWGPQGSPSKRDEFHKLYGQLQQAHDIGQFVWDGSSFHWNDNPEIDPEDFPVHVRIHNDVVAGTHYQRQVDVLREMGWTKSADDLVKHLAAQGVTVH